MEVPGDLWSLIVWWMLTRCRQCETRYTLGGVFAVMPCGRVPGCLKPLRGAGRAHVWGGARTDACARTPTTRPTPPVARARVSTRPPVAFRAGVHSSCSVHSGRKCRI
eukprot:4892340-Prymnesium_polylepis.1